MPLSAASFAARSSGDIASLVLVARIDGGAVGAGRVAWEALSAELHEAPIRIWVLRKARSQGIGGSLFARLAAFARAGGMTRTLSHVLEGDAASLAFAEHRGLTVFGRQQVGMFELSPELGLEAVALHPGLRIVVAAERPDLRRAAYDLEAAAMLEVPSNAGEPPPPFEAWLETLADPSYLDDLSLLALDGEAVVGAISVYDDGDGRVFIAMLSVAPTKRRLGIGRSLKLELARRAAVAGWRVLITQNDGTNEAIRRLNESLGYRFLPAMLLVQGPLPPG